MDEYLGIKTLRGNKLDYVAIGGFGLMVLCGIKVLADDIGKSADSMSIGADVVLIALFAWGVTAAVLRILQRGLAYKVAQYFYTYPKNDIYEDLIGKDLMMTKPSAKILSMQKKKYLQGINYDYQARCFHAYIKQPVADEDRGLPVKCPQCGANCTVYPARPLNKCPFCDLELVIGVNIDLL